MVRGLEKGQKAALVINEMQRGIVGPGAIFSGLADRVAAKNVVANIAALVELFRTRGLPVLHTHIVYRPDYAGVLPNTLISALTLKSRGVTEGSPEANAVAGLVPQASDFVCVRSAGLGVFYGTDLDATLRRLGVQTLIATGVSMNVALAGLSIGGTDRGYQVILPEDCAAGTSPEAESQMIEHQLRLLATISKRDELLASMR